MLEQEEDLLSVLRACELTLHRLAYLISLSNVHYVPRGRSKGSVLHLLGWDESQGEWDFESDQTVFEEGEQATLDTIHAAGIFVQDFFGFFSTPSATSSSGFCSSSTFDGASIELKQEWR